jgi:putative tricarboxylic transport membrane protein
LGGVFALSVMLPFTFAMTAIQAFCFLLGMHAVTTVNDEITSVLFAVPSESNATATILDGHPLAQQGRAGRAIGAHLFSSLIGGIFGAALLAVCIPLIRPFLLSFGNPELFMLVLLGLTFVASLSGKQILPGLIVAGLGLVLSMVGQDPITSQLRFTFGQLFLQEGPPLVSVVLGLFAVPALIELSIRRTSIAQKHVAVGNDVFEGAKDTLRHWKLVLVSSGIGALLGMIPGLGGSVSQWVAYGWARDHSKHKDQFGKGAIEGVLAPAAATNSKEGGHLLPTIVFGIPAGASMALLLGAFLIVGLVPGPKMLSDHLDITFAMVWILVLAHIVAVLVCLVFMRQLVALTHVKATILIPFILSFIFIGGYVGKNDMGGVLVTLIFGAIGYLMVLVDWPRPPLVLGFILGHLAENYLWLSQQTFGLTWLERPLVIVLAVVIALYLVYLMTQRRHNRVEELQAELAGAV